MDNGALILSHRESTSVTSIFPPRIVHKTRIQSTWFFAIIKGVFPLFSFLSNCEIFKIIPFYNYKICFYPQHCITVLETFGCDSRGGLKGGEPFCLECSLWRPFKHRENTGSVVELAEFIGAKYLLLIEYEFRHEWDNDFPYSLQSDVCALLFPPKVMLLFLLGLLSFHS